MKPITSSLARGSTRALPLVALLLAASIAEAQQLPRARRTSTKPYEIFVIQPFTPGGTHTTSATSVNELGHVTGIATTNENRAFLWSLASGAIDLGAAPSALSSAGRDLNAFDVVAGSSGTATVWTGVDELVRIPPPPGTYAPFAFGLNDLGRVVGLANISSNLTTAWVWDPLQGTRDLRTLGVPGASSATAINESNQIVGQHLSANYRAYRFDLDAGAFTDLGTLGGPTSEALGINDLGHVVGWARNANYNIRPFLWTPGGGMIDLGSLGGQPYDPGRAHAIDAAGRVVGTSSRGNGGYWHAFLWDAANGMRDLNALVDGLGTFELVTANRISNSGWIVGDGRDSAPGSLPRAYVLRPR